MRQLIKVLTLSFLIVSCGQSDTKQKELELKERELALKEKELALKERDTVSKSTETVKQQEMKADSNPISNQLANIFQIGVPITYKKLKSILGSETKIVKEEWITGEGTYDVFIWELADGAILELDASYEGGLIISAKGQQVVKTPLDISINQSTLNDCKTKFQNLQKGQSYNNLIRWKFKRGKTWHYLEFDKNSFLKKVWLLPWDAETTG